MSPAPGVRVRSAPDGARFDPSWLDLIARWLPGRRWYAGKQMALRSVSADGVVPLTVGGTRMGDVVWLVVVNAEFDDDVVQRYTVPVARVSSHRTGVVETDSSVIARLGDDHLLVDAMALPDTVAIVVGTSFVDAVSAGDRGTARGRPRRERLVAHPAMVRLLDVEQSNSSVLIGSTLIAKLVRRLEPGPNPDVELPAHLAALRFEHVPGLAASLQVELPGVDLPADVLIVHDAIPNDGDLWSILVEQLQREITGGTPFDDRHLPLAELVGRRTAELHIALAAPEAADGDPEVNDRLRPEPFTLDWQQRLVDTLRDGLLATQAAIAATSTLPTDDAALHRARSVGLFTDPPERLLARFARLEAELVDSMKIRVHGDLHLGQILATDGDVVFIDFEGEPGMPIGHRLVKRSPIVDLAGLVRSVDYLGRHVLRMVVVNEVVAPDAVEALDAARSAWTRRLTHAIVESYLAAIAPSHLVPAATGDAELLLDLYLLDKGLYEIRYELANRPDWVGGPLTAVTEMITR